MADSLPPADEACLALITVESFTLFPHKHSELCSGVACGTRGAGGGTAGAPQCPDSAAGRGGGEGGTLIVC